MRNDTGQKRIKMNNRKKINKIQRQMVYDKMDGHCAYCGCEISIQEMQVDHIYPLHKGGEDTLSNMFPACRSCNHYKSTLTIEKFRQTLERMPTTLARDSATYRNAVRFGLVHPNPSRIRFYFETHRKES